MIIVTDGKVSYFVDDGKEELVIGVIGNSIGTARPITEKALNEAIEKMLG